MGNIREVPDSSKKTVCENYASLHYGVSNMCGWREFMEDSHVIKYEEDVSIFAIFDGHGGKQSNI